MTITIAPPASSRTADVIEGLANLSAFLTTHPGLPLGSIWSQSPFTVHVYAGTDEENRDDVRRIAVILGVTPGLSREGGTHYSAVRHFGGGVTYQAIAIAKEAA